MVELQILSRIIKERNSSILRLNGITPDYFTIYKEEYEFLINHEKEYGNIPDKETFLSKFPDFSLIDVAETDKYLIDTFQEEHLYSLTVPVITKLAELIQTDSYAAVEYLHSQLPNLTAKGCVVGTDIVSQSKERLDAWEKRRENKEDFMIPTGFEELDEITGGWQRGEELVLIFARTGQGKSWILIKSLAHAHKMKFRVGLIEPEMSSVKTGYRFDTLYENISNKAMLRGENIPGYKEYIEELTKDDIPFFVASPKDFKRNITVSKLRSFIENNKLDILGVDGISYLKDERKERGDNRTTQLTNISEDLMDLSIELKIPILVVAQSNREGLQDGGVPDLENVRDSDGIAYNASVVLAVKQNGPGVDLVPRKNRNGIIGGNISYLWDIDTGKFVYNPEKDDEPVSTRRHSKEDKYSGEDEVF